MIRPDKGKWPITQGFGVNVGYYGPAGHDGIDIGAPSGSPVYAPRTGVVSMVHNSSIYGLRIKIANNYGNVDYTGHLSKTLVTVGQQVKEGDLIAYSGATGQVSGPHIHWGVYTKLGTPINPLTEMAKVNVKEEVVLNDQAIMWAYIAAYGTDPRKEDYEFWRGQPPENLLKALAEGNQDMRWKAGQFDTLKAQVATVAKENTDLKAKLALQGDDSINLTALGTALQWFVKRVGLK